MAVKLKDEPNCWQGHSLRCFTFYPTFSSAGIAPTSKIRAPVMFLFWLRDIKKCVVGGGSSDNERTKFRENRTQEHTDSKILNYTRGHPKFPNWVDNETTIIINTRWEATQRIMAAKLTRLIHKIAIQLHLVAESCTICSSRSRRPVRKLDTSSCRYVEKVDKHCHRSLVTNFIEIREVVGDTKHMAGRTNGHGVPIV
jgi:hypothetical protein